MSLLYRGAAGAAPYVKSALSRSSGQRRPRGRGRRQGQRQCWGAAGPTASCAARGPAAAQNPLRNEECARSGPGLALQKRARIRARKGPRGGKGDRGVRGGRGPLPRGLNGVAAAGGAAGALGGWRYVHGWSEGRWGSCMACCPACVSVWCHSQGLRALAAGRRCAPPAQPRPAAQTICQAAWRGGCRGGARRRKARGRGHRPAAHAPRPAPPPLPLVSRRLRSIASDTACSSASAREPKGRPCT
jgi:hypothetical protein